MCLFGDLGGVHFLVHEQQIVGLEVMEPLVPTDRPQPREPGEVEPKAGFPIIDIERLGTGGRRFTSGWLSMVTAGPGADRSLVPSGLHSDACTPRRNLFCITAHGFDGRQGTGSSYGVEPMVVNLTWSCASA